MVVRGSDTVKHVNPNPKKTTLSRLQLQQTVPDLGAIAEGNGFVLYISCTPVQIERKGTSLWSLVQCSSFLGVCVFYIHAFPGRLSRFANYALP